MKTISINVYTFQELLDMGDQKAIEKARDWLREAATDYDWWDYTLDTWKDALKQIGFDHPDISFSGFCCQGDGASFTADLDVDKLAEFLSVKTTPRNVIAGEPEDFRPWLAFKVGSYATDAKYKTIIGRDLTGCVDRTDRHYSHEMTCRAHIDGYGFDDEDLINKFEADVEELRIDLCRAIYHDLGEEYDYLNSDEQLLESADANDWTFTAKGKREG